MSIYKKIRIAISGPNASGKTTLAKAVHEKFDLPLIEEGVKPIFEAQFQFNRLRKASAPKEDLAKAKRAWADSFQQWVKDREMMYANHPGFVADRWEADLLDMWLVLFGRERSVDPLTVKLLKNLRSKARTLDLVILMPLSRPLTQENNDVNLQRATSFTNRLLNSVVTTGVIYSTPHLRVLKIPSTPMTTEQRLALVEEAVSRIVNREQVE